MGQIQNIILISLVCTGWYGITQPNMILSWVGRMRDKLPVWIAKPFGACVPCSASGIGTLAYLAVMRGEYDLIEWGVYIIAASFTNSLLWFTYTSVYERTQELRAIRAIREAQLKKIQKENINNCNSCGDGKDNKNTKLEEQRKE